MDDPSLTVPWDHAGWRYALLSGLAVGGSITATILPDDLDAVDDMRATYAGWLDWARRHEALVAFDTALGAQVRAGGVDIHARIDGRIRRRSSSPTQVLGPYVRGCHSTVPSACEEPGRYRLVVQTPERGPCIVGPDGTAALMAPGAVPIDVPAHTVLVLALEPAVGDAGQTIRSTDLRSPTIAVDGWTDDRGNPVSWPIHPAADSTPDVDPDQG